MPNKNIDIKTKEDMNLKDHVEATSNGTYLFRHIKEYDEFTLTIEGFTWTHRGFWLQISYSGVKEDGDHASGMKVNQEMIGFKALAANAPRSDIECQIEVDLCHTGLELFIEDVFSAYGIREKMGTEQ